MTTFWKMSKGDNNLIEGKTLELKVLLGATVIWSTFNEKKYGNDCMQYKDDNKLYWRNLAYECIQSKGDNKLNQMTNFRNKFIESGGDNKLDQKATLWKRLYTIKSDKKYDYSMT